MQEKQSKSYSMMKVAVMLLSAVLLLLVTGASPLEGVPQVYRSGVMLVLGAVVGVLSLYAAFRLARPSWWKLPVVVLLGFVLCGGAAGVWMGCKGFGGLPFDSVWGWVTALWYAIFVLVAATCAGVAVFVLVHVSTRKLWLAVAHLSLVAMGIGAYVDYFSEVKVPLALPVVPKGHAGAEVFMVDQVGSREEGWTKLGFRMGVRSFDVEFYENKAYSLLQWKDGAWVPVEKASARDGVIRFEKTRAVREKELALVSGMPSAFCIPETGMVVVKAEPTVKKYRAVCAVEDGKEKFDLPLEVNKPVQYGDWTFYLVSHGSNRGVTMVNLQARRSFGDVWMMGGIGALLVSLSVWCWWPKRKNVQEVVERKDESV